MSDKSTPILLTEAPPSLPSGNDYRELAVKIREIARQTRLPFARRELLRLATSYQRRGDHLDRRNSMFGALVTLHGSLYSALVSGALWLVMFTGPASANTIDLLADIMEIYSQGMMMATGDIYSQGMEIMFPGETTYSPGQGGVGTAPDWSDNSTRLGGTTNSRPPSQGCTTSNCNSNGTNTQTTSD